VLAALALTLLDHETPVWLDRPLADSNAMKSWLAFQCGAPLSDDPARAAFALIAEPAGLPPLALFAQGTDAFPDRSTTILIAATPTRQSLTLTGPGIDGSRKADLPIRPSLVAEWAENRALFPRGVDVVIAGAGEIIGLPRTTRLARG
jgi:alpha-D-ribose 1-methylphosphonate 5-triphosphate synthase subunit PhnH